jgi:FlaA1/EpsC-like NDP-sugar epimerase
MLLNILNKLYTQFQKTTSLNNFVLRYRLIFITLTQIFLIVISYIGSFSLRFDFQIPQTYLVVLIKTLPFLLACRLLTYYLYRLHSGWWSFVSMYDLKSITKAVLSGSILFILGIVFVYGTTGYPRSVLIIEAILNFILVGGVRFLTRLIKEEYTKITPKQISYALILGAGKAGALLLNEIRTNPKIGIRVVGFIDDDPIKKNAHIQGIPVLGASKDIPHLVKKYTIDEVIISIPSASYKMISSTVRLIKECGVVAKVLPSLGELIAKNGFLNQLRDVPYDELLERPILKFRREKDLSIIKKDIENKTIVITGAGGSIGSELSRQIAALNPHALILYDRNENNLYHIELELTKSHPNCNLIPTLGDISDIKKFNDTLAMHQVNQIYHTAAYKHVPMMEREPLEAVRNNILGTKNIAERAASHNIEKFVLISTDKAVKPKNIMGITKRICEMILQSLSGSGTKFIAVRFGNVIGSNGSVIPLFKEQILVGGPVTVTHPDASRYFMTISEAVQLVLTAGAMGQGGEIFLLDMGTPIKIVDLARRLIKNSGLTPEKDIEIHYTGLRPGEKLHEELYWKGEGIVPTSNKKITMLRPADFDKEFFFSQIAHLEKIETENNKHDLLEILKSIVPEASLESHKAN